MARVPYLTADDVPERFGHLVRPINLRGAMLNHPELCELFARIVKWFGTESTLEPRIRELAILQVAYSSSSAYEFSHHVHIAEQIVTPSEVLEIVGETSNGASGGRLDELERSVLLFAHQTISRGEVEDRVWAVVESHLGRAKLIELTYLVAYYSAVTKLIGVLEIEVEPEYASYLAPFDPPAGGWRW